MHHSPDEPPRSNERNAAMAALARSPEWTNARIGSVFGLTKQRVFSILKHLVALKPKPPPARPPTQAELKTWTADYATDAGLTQDERNEALDFLDSIDAEAHPHSPH